MVENLKKTIEALKHRIRYNLDLIQSNEKRIRELLKEPVSEERSEKLNKRFNINNKMIKENDEAIKLQRNIITYLENYADELTHFPEAIEVEKSKKSIQVNTKVEINREDYFDLTVSKALDFNKNHPYFKDKSFARDLLNHFIEIEDYEMCARINNFQEE